jgi:Raf kinase inhibitor-like YbhB/YbcL family protein
MKFQLSSSAFENGAAIPKDHTGDGANHSPPLAWLGSPEGTESFALVCEDPDAPRGVWVHWVLFNLPGDSKELPKALPLDSKLSNGAFQGKNDFGKIGYGGPAPPPGKAHRYFFTLYALKNKLALSAGATKSQLISAMEGSILGQAKWMGVYKR